MWSRCEVLSPHRSCALAGQDCFCLARTQMIFFGTKSRYLAVFRCTIIRVLTTSTGLLAMQAESPAKKLRKYKMSPRCKKHWEREHLAAKWHPAPSLTPCASNWAFEASYTGSCNIKVNTRSRAPKKLAGLNTWTPATSAARWAVGNPPRHNPRIPSCLKLNSLAQ